MKNLLKIIAVFFFLCAFFLGCASTKTTAPSAILESAQWILDGEKIEQCHLGQTVTIFGTLKKGAGKNGARIFIAPYYFGENGEKIALDEMSTAIQKGQFEAQIELPALEARADSQAYFVPEFSFSLRLEDGREEEAEVRLKAYAWIKTQFFERGSAKPLANRDFVVYKLGVPKDEIYGKTDEEGYLFLKWLPVGRYFINFG